MERRKALGGILSAAALFATAGRAAATEAAKPGDATKSKYTPWIGDLDRSKINWGPTVDAAKCIACGMCMNCGRKVYDWTNKKPSVARPSDCMVGCRTCMNLCPAGAISFPPLADVKAYMAKEKIYDRIKTILKEQGKIPQDG